MGLILSRRYATDCKMGGRKPWVETHGYHHGVATRRITRPGNIDGRSSQQGPRGGKSFRIVFSRGEAGYDNNYAPASFSAGE